MRVRALLLRALVVMARLIVLSLVALCLDLVRRSRRHRAWKQQAKEQADRQAEYVEATVHENANASPQQAAAPNLSIAQGPTVQTGGQMAGAAQNRTVEVQELSNEAVRSIREERAYRRMQTDE